MAPIGQYNSKRLHHSRLKHHVGAAPGVGPYWEVLHRFGGTAFFASYRSHPWRSLGPHLGWSDQTACATFPLSSFLLLFLVRRGNMFPSSALDSRVWRQASFPGGSLTTKKAGGVNAHQTCSRAGLDTLQLLWTSTQVRRPCPC
eukprot:1157433-Pelagomonas_calceolata.AAC.12